MFQSSHPYRLGSSPGSSGRHQLCSGSITFGLWPKSYRTVCLHLPAGVSIQTHSPSPMPMLRAVKGCIFTRGTGSKCRIKLMRRSSTWCASWNLAPLVMIKGVFLGYVRRALLFFFFEYYLKISISAVFCYFCFIAHLRTMKDFKESGTDLSIFVMLGFIDDLGGIELCS